MAGSSAITLFRSELSTIDLAFQARQAARTLALDLSTGTLRVQLRTYPSETTLIEVTPAGAVSGCTLVIVNAAAGLARLTIPSAFWTANTGRRFSAEAYFDTPSGTQRLGEQTFDVTD